MARTNFENRKNMSHKFNYQWTLQDAVFTKDKGKVFSCFACGGGSTMGYKLAGFDVIGHNDIDKKMIEVYQQNHKPKFSFLESITTFAKRKDLPKELYELDILDGSPPCSSFSMAGNREKDWGKEKVFREGQAEQVLDTLFFDFIDLAKELQPKVVIAENVKGLLLGAAKEYVIKIYKAFEEAGYYCQHFLLDGSTMGVPQRRERVFFVCLRKDLAVPFLHWADMFTEVPEIDMRFNEKKIYFGEYRSAVGNSEKVTERQKRLLELRLPNENSFGEISLRVDNKLSGFTDMIVDDDMVSGTITANGKNFRSFDNCWFTDEDYIRTGSFPLDYDFLTNRAQYLIGMSVPPLMTANVASNVYDQWLSKL
jgi:DNA (cytosine-5)-methyltransferase 1